MLLVSSYIQNSDETKGVFDLARRCKAIARFGNLVKFAACDSVQAKTFAGPGGTPPVAGNSSFRINTARLEAVGI